MKETTLRPIEMRIDIYGSGNYNGKTVPFPSIYISDALSQNILYHCYEQAHNVEDLAKLCGVPAYYIEERIDHLKNHEAIVEQTKGKYRTDFIIWSDKYGIYCEENAEKALLPILDDMLEALDKIAENADKIPFYKADKSKKDLYYLYGIMAFSYADQRYCDLPCPPVLERYDGYRWRYIANMESGKHKRIGIVTRHSANLGSRGSYSHTVYGRINGFAWRDMMYDFYINVCEDILRDGKTEDLDSAAGAIQNGYITRHQDGSLFVTTPAFTKEQKAEFDAVAEKHLAPLMEEYRKDVKAFLAGYKKLFPKHLSEDADRMCKNMFTGLFNAIAGYAQKTGKWEMPTQGSVCDVLIQHK